MRILALDSSTSACSVAVWDGDNETEKIVAQRRERMERGQSEALAPMVQDVLSDAGVSVQDMDFLAVTTGPGAFTGVRIGLAMARALGLASGASVVGVSTMAAVAHGVPKSESSGAWIVVVMDTKREDVYAQVFDPSLSPACEPDVIAPDDLPAMMACIPDGEAALIVGDTTDHIHPDILDLQNRLRVRIREGALLPDATVVAEIVAGSASLGQDPASLAPIYLRPPYAKISPTGGKLRP